MEKLLREEVPTSKKVIIHCFSNGGVFFLNNILPEKSQFIFPKIYKIIYDSAPCYLDAISGARAMSYGFTSKPLYRTVIANLLVPVFFFGGIAKNLISGENPAIVFWEKCRTYPFYGDELFLYSDNDALCDVDKLQGLIEARRAVKVENGCSGVTDSVNYKTSPHVLHYKMFPVEYEMKVFDFIGDTLDDDNNSGSAAASGIKSQL